MSDPARPGKFAGLSKLKTHMQPEPEVGAPEPPASRPAREAPAAQRTFGKRSNPEFTQVTAYIRKTTYSEAQIKIIRDRTGDFSEVVEALLALWVKGKVKV